MKKLILISLLSLSVLNAYSELDKHCAIVSNNYFMYKEDYKYIKNSSDTLIKYKHLTKMEINTIEMLTTCKHTKGYNIKVLEKELKSIQMLTNYYKEELEK